MAQAIWVDFQSRSVGTLKTVGEVAFINADTYSERERWAYVNYLDTSNITSGQIAELQRITLANEKLPSRARRKVSEKDIVYSTVRPNQRHFGIISFPVERMLVSTGFAVIRSSTSLVCNEYLYLLLSSEPVIEKLQQLAEQSVSTYPSIKPSDIGTLEVLVPTEGEAVELEELLTPLFSKIAVNNEESQRLAELRNTLLPRLMSGELPVRDCGSSPQ
jgi:type I restriction enzyme S subunit